MEYIEKNNSLETAKNRLYISGLTYVTSITGTTQYVHDRCVDSNTDDVIKIFLPLVPASGDSGYYILRYKNLVRQYYWLINKFIPTCTLKKVCIRNSEKKLVPYNDQTKTEESFKEHIVYYYYGTNIISMSTVIDGEKARNFEPHRLGYTFNGWIIQDRFFNFDTPITSDISLYANYTRQSFSITFHLNNGQGDTTMTVYYGETPEIADPIKQGSEFMGWNPSLAPATANTEYNATYSTDVYTVRFYNIREADDLLDGDNYLYQPIDGGDNAKYLVKETEQIQYNDPSQYYQTIPTYTHFDFDGWIDSNGDRINNDQFEHIYANIDAYPQLKKEIYSVNFYDWNGTPINSQRVEYMGDATRPSDPTRENYVFVKWSTSYTGIKYNTSIYAEYIGDTLTYEFLLPNSAGTEYDLYRSGSTHYNSAIPSVPSPSTSVYDPYIYGVFDGWYTDNQYQNRWDSTSLVTANMTIYGKWKIVFEVSFYNSDNTFISGATENPVYVKYGGSVSDDNLVDIGKNVEVPTGYLFTGWNKPTTNIIRDTKITALIGNLQE